MANAGQNRLWAVLKGAVLFVLLLFVQALISGVIIAAWADNISGDKPVTIWQGIVSFVASILGILGADSLLLAIFKASYPRKIILRIVFWFWLAGLLLVVALILYNLRFELLSSEEVIRETGVVVIAAYLLRGVSKANSVGVTADVFGPNATTEERVPLMKGLWRMIVGAAVMLPQLFFFVWGLVQLAAVYGQVHSLWHLPRILTFFISAALSYVPIVGAIFGFFGAKDVWGWEWWQAALLYFGAPLLFMVLAIVISSASAVADRVNRQPS